MIATSLGLSRCLLLGINLNLQSESLAQEQISESGGPGHRQLKASWPWLGNKTVSPTCSTPRWMLWFTHNLLTVYPADGRCTWHSDVIVPQCLAFVGFVSCEGDFLLPLPESCPTWLWVTHLCFEDWRVSTGQRHWWTTNSRKVKPQEADPRIGQNLDNQWCVCFLWTASLLVRHLWEGEKSLIIKVDCNASML